MLHPTLEPSVADSPVMPWSLRAWPPLLWQLDAATRVRFRHLDTRVTFVGNACEPTAGQTMWAGRADDGAAGMAWDWVQVGQGVVAMADPMSVVTNLRLLGSEGEVLTAHAAARCFETVIEKAGYAEFMVTRPAYSIGCAFPPGWGEDDVAAIRRNSDQLLEAGMCFHVVPCLYRPGLGCVAASMPSVLTEAGFQPLCDDEVAWGVR